MGYRIGNGFDVHKFSAQASEEGSITLAGIRIAHPWNLLAHSDGDVVVHALCDAMLGALALGDIGDHFPDNDPRYRNIDSLLLLKNVNALIAERGWELANADMTILAEAPKISPHKGVMRQTLADTLELPAETISIKATTTEELGFTGRREGIAVYAVVLLQDKVAPT